MKLSDTIQRRVILRELCAMRTHPNAAELYNEVRKSLPRISLGTVYRNLDLLSEAGMIRKLECAGEEKRYDGNVEPHLHLRCGLCGAVEDFHPDGKLVFELDRKLRQLLGTRYEGFSMEIRGLCTPCAVRKNQQKKGEGK